MTQFTQIPMEDLNKNLNGNSEGGGDLIKNGPAAFQNNQNEKVDFILVWNSEEEPASFEEEEEFKIRKLRRETFEKNLRNEGLILENERAPDGCAPGLNFVKITAPIEVLERYAEILKLRLPMKKLENVKEIQIEQLNIPIVTDVVHGVSTWFHEKLQKLYEPYMWDTDKLPSKKHQLTSIFSRDKKYLFEVEKPDFFSQSVRSRVIEFILKRKRLSEDANDDFAFGIDRALVEGIYVAAYPLHDGSLKEEGGKRPMLYTEWASLRKLFKFQPLDAIRDYFGVKIAFYFAWLGFYTMFLTVPSIVGIVTVLYGLATMNADVTSKEICEDNAIKMCPACDNICSYWDLKEMCSYHKVMHLFDNDSTVFFAIVMSIWAALFQEFWKRYSREITHRWDITGYTPDEDHPRPEYLAQLKNVKEKTINYITQSTEPKVPFWSRKVPGILLSVSTIVFMICLVLIAVMGVILYRMSMVITVNLVTEDTIKSNATLFISTTAACINLVCILLIGHIYEKLAVRLTEMEFNRTQTQFDDSLSLKIYIFNFVNYYASIFYIGFFKGNRIFIGYPGKYTRVLGYRQEECGPGGCYMEVCLQLAIIFVGKQFLLGIVEYQLPNLFRIFNTMKIMAGLKGGDKENYAQWIQDFQLVDWGKQGLFYEYLEMVIQYGFITIFVSAFPLAPLFALLNNIFELRLDAKKLLVLHRRPVAHRVRDIGVWLKIMDSLGRISVVTNAFIIAFTSEFIPRLVYQYKYSNDNTLTGYLNFTLSSFNPKDFENHNHDEANMLVPNDIIHPKICRYRDFRHPPEHEKQYQETDAFWHVLAARMAFVVVFQNCVALVVMAIKWIVPNLHSDIEDRCRREAYVTNEVIIRSELLKAKGIREVHDDDIPEGVDDTGEESMLTQEFLMKSIDSGNKHLGSSPTVRRRNVELEAAVPNNDTDDNALFERVESQMIGDKTDTNIIV